MRSWYPRLTCVAVAATAVIALAGCTSSRSDSNGLTGAPPIVIGTSLPLTGSAQQDPFTADGQAFERGYRLWAADVNAHGGLLGRQVKLIILDNRGSTTKVQADYRTLINVDHVNLTFGPFSTLLTVPAEEVVGPAGYALIEGAGGAPAVFTSKADAQYHNVFDPSLPVVGYLNALVKWMQALPPSQRPKTAAYPSSNDPFTLPAVAEAQAKLSKLGIRTVYTDWKNATAGGFNETPATAMSVAQKVIPTKPQMVVLGSTAVPTVQAVMKVFEAQNFNPKVFLATSGPDQGQAFISAVGKANANGVMVLTGWFGGYNDALSNYMDEEYIALYGGNAASINADVAEAYSVGEIAAAAITATNSVSNSKIINYLHGPAGLGGPVTLQTVQGPAQFKPDGENPFAASFVSQWQSGSFVQVLSTTGPPSGIIYPKRPWGQ